MNWNDCFAKLKKYPIASGTLVLCAVLSILMEPSSFPWDLLFTSGWLLGVAMLVQILLNHKAEVTDRVSGIVPAWILLIFGIVALFLCPIRAISLGLVLLAVCSYSAGIIFSTKIIIPFALLLGIPGYGAWISKFISSVADFCCGVPAVALLNRSGRQFTWIGQTGFMKGLDVSSIQEHDTIIYWSDLWGSADLVMLMLLLAFCIAWGMQKTRLDRFYHGILILPVLWLTVILHIILAVRYVDHRDFLCGLFCVVLFIFAGFPQKFLSGKKTKASVDEK